MTQPLTKGVSVRVTWWLIGSDFGRSVFTSSIGLFLLVVVVEIAVNLGTHDNHQVKIFPTHLSSG